MPRTKIILNVDTGIDDAFAMVLAMAARETVDLLAVTTSFGNKGVDITTINTLRIASLINLDAPIAVGRGEPIVTPARFNFLGTAAQGDDGLGNKGGMLPFPTLKPIDLSAVELMARTLFESKEKVSIVSTAPLTNVAILLLTHPELKDKIASIIFSGGAIEKGNILPTVDANILADPEAAQIVLNSGLDIVICPLDICEEAYATFEDRERFRRVTSKSSRFLFETLKHYSEHYENLLGKDGCPLYDVVPLAYIIKPEIIETKEYYVEIDLNGYYTRGATVMDSLGMLKKEPNVKVVTSLQRNEIIKIIIDSLRRVR